MSKWQIRSSILQSQLAPITKLHEVNDDKCHTLIDDDISASAALTSLNSQPLNGYEGPSADSDPILLNSRKGNKRVTYHLDPEVGNYHFGDRHPMKPHRMTLTNNLVLGYNLHRKMDMYAPRKATREELEEFHASDYIDFLKRVTPDNAYKFADVLHKYNFGDDCPIFDNMYEFCQRYAGASLDAARRLNLGRSDIAINWSGGLHHSKRSEASGFCYVNDIVLAILALLRLHSRVLYIDIDIHHGDGVQEAFYFTDRVMTVSFHKYNRDFFPGTGSADEIGLEEGKYYAINVPLDDGIDDESYLNLFKGVIEPIIHTYRPAVIVLQCGADSLGCDRLGCFNLSIRAHGECVRFCKTFQIPLLLLGGGGYTVRNVALAWCYETAISLDVDLPAQLPPTSPYREFWAPEYSLHPRISTKMENKNTRKSLDALKEQVLEQLKYIRGAPNVQMQEIPPDIIGLTEDGDASMEDKASDMQ